MRPIGADSQRERERERGNLSYGHVINECLVKGLARQRENMFGQFTANKAESWMRRFFLICLWFVNVEVLFFFFAIPR